MVVGLKHLGNNLLLFLVMAMPALIRSLFEDLIAGPPPWAG